MCCIYLQLLMGEHVLNLTTSVMKMRFLVQTVNVYLPSKIKWQIIYTAI